MKRVLILTTMLFSPCNARSGSSRSVAPSSKEVTAASSELVYLPMRLMLGCALLIEMLLDQVAH